MKADEIITELNKYRNNNTIQTWKMTSLDLENDYIKILRIDSSNKHGGTAVINGKQWGIIILIKKDFTKKTTWKELVSKDNNIKITRVKKGEFYEKYKNAVYGIRFYGMSVDPNEEIIKIILDFIFSS